MEDEPMKAKKIILTITAVFFGLLVLANSFMVYILINLYREEHAVTDLTPGMHMSVLLNNDEEAITTDFYKGLVADTLKSDPHILNKEPVIFLANPAIKPIVAEVLEEEPVILQSEPNIITYYPELIELNPDLKDVVKELLQDPVYERDYPRLKKLVA